MVSVEFMPFRSRVGRAGEGSSSSGAATWPPWSWASVGGDAPSSARAAMRVK